MHFVPTKLLGVYLIEVERFEDERGFFARTWSAEEFSARGLTPALAQCSISFNVRKGTLRGMHYQAAPHAEVKLIRCTRGAIYDVALDLRPTSPTFKQWFAAELTDENRAMLYIPEGCAHGFQTLADQSEVFYQISAPHRPDAARGVRWNDPAFGITWRGEVEVMAERDRNYADFATQGAQ